MWQWRQVLNLFFEAPCFICQRSTAEGFCDYCWKQILDCQLPSSEALDLMPLPVMAWGNYSGALRRAIATFKYDNQPAMGRWLGKALGETWRTHVTASGRVLPRSSNLIAVPIPMHESKRRHRGYNQAEILAEAFCNTTGISLERNAVRRIRETQAQFGLSADDRERNLVGAFLVKPQWVRRSPNAKILLIDDIYTTGATVRSAATALKTAGIQVWGSVALARAQKHC